MVDQAQAIQENVQVRITPQSHKDSSASSAEQTSAPLDRIEQGRAENSRMRTALSVKEGKKVDPKGATLPLNNMIAMFKLMFHASNTLKKVLESERTQMKMANKKWEKESENKAQHHSDAAWWQNVFSQAQSVVGLVTMALPMVAQHPRLSGMGEQLKFAAQKISEIAPAAISAQAESKKSDIDIKMTRTEFHKDSSRMSVEINRDELRQLEGAIDQLNNLIHELIRLEGKTYTQESG